jgi:prepilin-type N-terminal cleavage/methylation domain-containing protein
MRLARSPGTTRAFPRNNKGFTFLELLVVLIILGVLLSIAIGLMLDMRERSYVATIKSDLNGAFEAALDFHTSNPSAIATLNDLRDHGYRESLNVTTVVVDGTLDNLKITATHVGVSGIYEIDHEGRIAKQ